MRIAVGVGAWLLGVGAATGGSLLAVSLLGQGIAANTSQQLTAAAVSRALASETSDPPNQGTTTLPSATPSPVRSSRTRRPATPPPQPEVTPSSHRASADPTASPTPHPTGRTGATPTPTPSPTPTHTTPPPTVLTSQGGSVVAECLSAGAYLLSWSPTQGYEAGQVLRGPAPTVQVAFQSYANTVTMVVSCSTGVPTATITVTNGYGGGGGHDE
jgi:serine/threonine-protein kinase